VAERDDAPGAAALGFVIVFGSLVIATFAAVLQRLLQEALVMKYQLQDSLASVRAPLYNSSESSDEEKYMEAAKVAVAEDRADVIVLGCAGMTGQDKRMQKELGIPVLDGVICALILTSALI